MEEGDGNHDDDVHLPPLPSNSSSHLVTVPETDEDIESQTDRKRELFVLKGSNEDKMICIPPVGRRDSYSSASESKFMAGPNPRYQAHFVRMLGAPVPRPLPVLCETPVTNARGHP